MCKTHTTKTFLQQDIHGTHLGAFGGHYNLHISNTTNFYFSQNTPPRYLALSCHTAKLHHVQNLHNPKALCTKTFMVFIWGHLEVIPTLTSQKQWISIFHKTPHWAIYLSRETPPNLAMCETHPTQNTHANKLSWYSFGGIWRPFQP